MSGSLDPSLARHLERITGYLRGTGLRSFPPEQRDLRVELAAFIERRTPHLLRPWLGAVGGALGIPPESWPRIGPTPCVVACR